MTLLPLYASGKTPLWRTRKGLTIIAIVSACLIGGIIGIEAIARAIIEKNRVVQKAPGEQGREGPSVVPSGSHGLRGKTSSLAGGARLTMTIEVVPTNPVSALGTLRGASGLTPNTVTATPAMTDSLQ